MARRAMIIVLGVLAAGTLVAALVVARVEKVCGHRQPALDFLARRFGLGDRSHDPAEASIHRWRERPRIEEDFRRIHSHLEQEMAAPRLRSVLGEPDARSSIPFTGGTGAEPDHEMWRYDLDDGALEIMFTHTGELVFWRTRSSRTVRSIPVPIRGFRAPLKPSILIVPRSRSSSRDR